MASLALIGAIACSGPPRPQGSWLRGVTRHTDGDRVGEYRGRDGQRILITCGPERTPEAVWGVDVYTDDSSVCTAAVHAGRINASAGGRVVVEIAPGQGSYSGSERNGVTSQSYGDWPGSFIFVTPPERPSCQQIVRTVAACRNAPEHGSDCEQVQAMAASTVAAAGADEASQQALARLCRIACTNRAETPSQEALLVAVAADCARAAR